MKELLGRWKHGSIYDVDESHLSELYESVKKEKFDYLKLAQSVISLRDSFF